MLKKEVNTFLKSIIESEGDSYNIVFKFYPALTMGRLDAYINIIKLYKDDDICDGAILSLSRKAFCGNTDYDIIIQKAMLLHEVGHIYTRSFKNSRREYKAQVWAYNKAIELNLLDVSRAIKCFTSNWENSSKRGRYYKAHIIAKKLNFI